MAACSLLKQPRLCPPHAKQLKYVSLSIVYDVKINEMDKRCFTQIQDTPFIEMDDPSDTCRVNVKGRVCSVSILEPESHYL